MPKPLRPFRFKARLIRSRSESGIHMLEIERKIAEKFPSDGKSRRVVCTIENAEPFQCALLPSGESFYIIVNKTKRDALGLRAGDTVNVTLIADDSKYGLPMPEEFREVLAQDPDGDRIFHSLTAGKQRSLLYFVGNIKDIDKRIHQALVIMEHLKENGKVIDRVLYEELRRPMF